MVKPLNEFGGWLRFFQILFGFIVIADLITVGFLLFPNEMIQQSMEENEITGNYLIFAVITYITFMPLLGLIIFKMNEPTPETAKLISKIAVVYSVLLIVVSFIEPLFGSESFSESYKFPQHILIPSLFYLNLYESKRVNAFYGVNPGKKEPTLSKEEIQQIRKEVFQGSSKMFWIIGFGGVITLLILFFLSYINGQI